MFSLKSGSDVTASVVNDCKELYKIFSSQRYPNRGKVAGQEGGGGGGGGTRNLIAAIANKDAVEALSIKDVSREDRPEVVLLRSLLKNSCPRQGGLGDGNLLYLSFTTLLIHKCLDLEYLHLGGGGTGSGGGGGSGGRGRGENKKLTEITNGIKHVTSFVEEYLCSSECDLTVPVGLSDVKGLLAVIKTSLVPKAKGAGLDEGQRQGETHVLSKVGVDELALVILKAFISSVRVSGASDVQFQTFVGHGSIGVKCLERTVFLDCPPHAMSGFSRRGEDGGKVLNCMVFSCSLYQKSVGKDETTTAIANRFDFKVDDEMEIARLLKLGVEIVYSGVEVVFCQRQVHPRLAEFLESSYIAVFHRLGIARVGRVGRVCGCRVVNDWEELLNEGGGGGGGAVEGGRMGRCVLNAYKGFPPHKLVATVQAPSGDVHGGSGETGPATVVLTGLTERAVKKKRDVIVNTLTMLEGLLRKGGEGKGIGGAGCWESVVVELVREKKWEGLTPWERKGVEVWADCLARTVGGEIGMVDFDGGVKVETFEGGGGGSGGYGGRHGSLFSANASGLAKRVTMTARDRAVVCVKSVERGGRVRVEEGAVIDLLDVVLAALKAASEVASVMLSVGGAMMMK
ncbi:hypothetical protein TrST_g8184 [Triparma strigata]|uniref:Uncharacterized protein n=1 Tax=Triparma strigata TaxID=1606541 RepID=A0A9W7C171_9STRA|nr:hypothetical protein TrST_g8184 [Triparma strigata]